MSVTKIQKYVTCQVYEEYKSPKWLRGEKIIDHQSQKKLNCLVMRLHMQKYPGPGSEGLIHGF